MGLNYKKINFKTEWLALTSIKPTYEKLGLPPTPHPVEKPFYTVPALIDTSTTPPVLLSGSTNIERYLEEKYPDPPLFAVRPSGYSDAEWEAKLAVLTQIDQFLSGEKDPRWRVLFGFLIPSVAKYIKDEDLSYFKETRSRWFQKPFEEIGYKGEEAQAKLVEVKAAMDTLEEVIVQGEGKYFNPSDPNSKPWVLGDVVSRGDFALLGPFTLISKVDPELWDKIKTWNSGRWGRMVELSAEWK